MIEPSQLDGRRLLIGVTREHSSGETTQDQFAGTAHIQDRGDYCLVVVDCSDGEIREFPFDVRTIEKAPAGEYRLQSTGEIVTNPDFLMTWIVSGGSPEE